MNTLLSQILSLLTSEAGSFTYQLVLAFSIAGAFPGAAQLARSGDTSRGVRLIGGLSSLLALRLLVFAATGWIWLGAINPGLLLPFLDRSVALISIIAIIWLWVFPDPSRTGDTATLLVAMLSLTLLILVGVWRVEQGADLLLYGTWIVTGIDYYALGLIAIGVVLLIIRQTPGWGFGLAMMVGLGAGYLIDLFVPIFKGELASAIRLTQIITYPILLVLPYRFSMDERASQKGKSELPEATQPSMTRRHAGLDIKTLQFLIGAGKPATQEEVNTLLVKAIGHAMMADICLFIKYPNESDQLEITAGYDLIRERPFPGFSLSLEQAPILAESLTQDRALRLLASSASPDLVYLALNIKTEKSGNLLAVPICPTEDLPKGGTVLLTPYTNRTWSEADEAALLSLVVQLKSFSRQQQGREGMPKPELAVMQSELDKVTTENITLREENASLHKNFTDDQAQLLGLTALIAALQKELDDSDIDETGQEASLKTPPLGGKAAGDEEAREELRLALLEVAYLNTLIDELTQRRKNRTAIDSETVFSREQMDHIYTMAKELRQPIASLIGFTDVLLSETHGILVDRQRRIIERIRVSNERLARIVDDLIRSLDQEVAWASRGERQDIDLNSALQQAILETDPVRSEKQISLVEDFPESIPLVQVNPEALHQVLVQILENANHVSAAKAEISLRARLQSGEGNQDFVLLQITDAGDGYSPADLKHSLSTIYPEMDGESVLSGQDGSELAIVRPLIESFGGRILVDSAPGKGSTFSLLLPVGSENGDLPGW